MTFPPSFAKAMAGRQSRKTHRSSLRFVWRSIGKDISGHSLNEILGNYFEVAPKNAGGRYAT